MFYQLAIVPPAEVAKQTMALVSFCTRRKCQLYPHIFSMIDFGMAHDSPGMQIPGQKWNFIALMCLNV